MKFLYSDSLDFVDPSFDFIADRTAAKRRSHTDDDFPHEHLKKAPYDGLLVSRAIVGDARRPGKYSEAQCMRFWREGARSFLRYPKSKFPNSMIMGDCGAFSYRNAHVPPYSVGETLDFYADGGFSHGCSVDHLIFDFIDDRAAAPKEAKRRFDITLENANAFFKQSKALKGGFTPLGVIQGWSAKSMAAAAVALCKQGYTYLAAGGMVPLRIEDIDHALDAIRDAIPARTKLHVLGFGKTEHLDVLQSHKVASFDTTSPLLRAFKDGRRNFYSRDGEGKIQYYTAIRIPQAIDNDKLLRRAKRGRLDQDHLVTLEAKALTSIRGFGSRRIKAEKAVEDVLAYGRYALWDDRLTNGDNEKRLNQLKGFYLETLVARPWENCKCRVCSEIGVEAVIFRSSNRNKRRGMHNLHIFYQFLSDTAF